MHEQRANKENFQKISLEDMDFEFKTMELDKEIQMPDLSEMELPDMSEMELDISEMDMSDITEIELPEITDIELEPLDLEEEQPSS